MLVDALSTRERVETADKKNFKCQGLGWQPQNIAHWPRCWASLGTGTWQVWAAKLQPLCLSVFGKSSSHQQGQRMAFTSKAQDRTSKNGEGWAGASSLACCCPSKGAWCYSSPAADPTSLLRGPRVLSVTASLSFWPFAIMGMVI